jgi:hypothetical protein
MTEFDKIYLSWRKGIGNVRFIVGVLEKTTTDSFVFQYDNEQVEQAGKEGFKPYTEFSDTAKLYNGNVLDIFAQRLIKSDRTDVQKFYDFWEIEPQFFNDKFYLLGHTQGLLPTDHFEFLADYNPVSHLHLLTDLARVEIQQHSSDRLAEGDELQVRLEKDNQHDSEAVAVYKNDLKIGYIKKVHCRVFHKEGGAKLKLKVKAVDKNGIIKKAFVKVYSDNN